MWSRRSQGVHPPISVVWDCEGPQGLCKRHKKWDYSTVPMDDDDDGDDDMMIVVVVVINAIKQ